MSFRFNQGDRPLDGYTIQRGVGRGGFGEVYYAVSDGGKEVALKYLRDNPGVELRGVSACLNLKSPHLVSVYDVRQSVGGEWFVVMEFVAGPSLRELMNASPGGLGPQKAAYLIREIGKGLTYLHDRGIVHRDLKPGNVFYDEGYVKIGDYGLSKYMTASQHSGQTVSVGTVHYMAPEIGSGNYDRTIDVYALGVMLYEMLLGKVPFAGATVGEILMKHLTAQPEVDALPAPFPEVIRKALCKDPKDRYATVPDMMAAMFTQAELDRSVAAFEPASLSAVAARAVRPGGGGVAVAQGGSSNFGRFPGAGIEPPPIIGSTPRISGQGSDDEVVRKFERAQEKIGKIAEKVDRTRLGRRVAAGVSTRSPIERAFIGLLLVAGFSYVTGLIISDGPPSGAVLGRTMLVILAMVQGVLLGCWLGFHRYKFKGVWLTRFLIAAIVAVVVFPAPSPLVGTVSRTRKAAIQRDIQRRIARDTAAKLEAERSGIDSEKSSVAQENSLALSATAPVGQPIAMPILLLMVLADWPKRFFEGRRGRVSLGMAFSVWIGTLILTGITTDVHPAVAVAFIAAAASLAVQSIAGLWPMRDGEIIPAAVLKPSVGVIAQIRPREARGGAALALQTMAETAGPLRSVPMAGGGSTAESDRKTARMQRRGGRTLAIGIIWCCSLGAIVPILVNTVNHTQRQWLIPAVAVPNAMGAAGLIIWGSILLARAAGRKRKLTLPLRRVFEVADVSHVAAVVERHFFTLGYTPQSRGELVWSFERGSVLTAPWDSNFRKLRTNVNVAAYQLSTHRWQIRCYLDVQTTAPWQVPDQAKLFALNAEFDDLRTLLNATEIADGPLDSDDS